MVLKSLWSVLPTKFLFVVEIDLYFCSPLGLFLKQVNTLVKSTVFLGTFRFAKKHEHKNSSNKLRNSSIFFMGLQNLDSSKLATKPKALLSTETNLKS